MGDVKLVVVVARGKHSAPVKCIFWAWMFKQQEQIYIDVFHQPPPRYDILERQYHRGFTEGNSLGSGWVYCIGVGKGKSAGSKVFLRPAALPLRRKKS